MAHLHCISYAQGHRVKRVGVHGCCLSPFLVNGWWTRYIGRRPIKLHDIHGCKSTLCMVLIVEIVSSSCSSLVLALIDSHLNRQNVGRSMVKCFGSVKRKNYGFCPFLQGKCNFSLDAWKNYSIGVEINPN